MTPDVVSSADGKSVRENVLLAAATFPISWRVLKLLIRDRPLGLVADMGPRLCFMDEVVMVL